MSKIFNSNETLEMCDVKVSDNGRLEVITKSYHHEELERLGKPAKTVRGRVKMEGQNLQPRSHALDMEETWLCNPRRTARCICADQGEINS